MPRSCSPAFSDILWLVHDADSARPRCRPGDAARHPPKPTPRLRTRSWTPIHPIPGGKSRGKAATGCTVSARRRHDQGRTSARRGRPVRIGNHAPGNEICHAWSHRLCFDEARVESSAKPCSHGLPLFEGTAQQMYAALRRLASPSDDTGCMRARISLSDAACGAASRHRTSPSVVAIEASRRGQITLPIRSRRSAHTFRARFEWNSWRLRAAKTARS